MNLVVVRARLAVDILFAIGLVAALLLGGKVTPLLIVAGVLPIPFLFQTIKRQKLEVSTWRIVAPFAAYFSYCLASYFFFTGIDESTTKPVNPSLEFYVVAICMVFVGFFRGLQISDISAFFVKWIPYSLLVAFFILTYLMFAGIRVDCRVEALAPWPFIPALVFSTLSILVLTGWERMTGRERKLRLLLLSFSVVVTIAYTGSRGIAVGQGVVFLILLLAGWISKLRGQVPTWSAVLFAGLAGVGLSLAIGLVTGCGPVKRFATTIEWTKSTISSQLPSAFNSADAPEGNITAGSNTIPETSEQATQTASDPPVQKSDKSIDVRLELWKLSLDAIYDNPLWGHGSLYMRTLIEEPYGFQHNHNQYLSWLVTGGVIQLSLGLFFLATPWIISNRFSIADRLIITLSTSILWGFAMIFDSFFNLKFYTHYYCLLCGLLYAWANRVDHAGVSAKPLDHDR